MSIIFLHLITTSIWRYICRNIDSKSLRPNHCCYVKMEERQIIPHHNLPNSWWRHQMEAFSALLVICAGIQRSLVTYQHKGQWRGASIFFFFICAEINGWVKNRDAGDLRCRLAHYDVTVMWRTDISLKWIVCFCCLENCCITGLYDLNYYKCLIINSAAVPIEHGIFERRGQYAELIGSLIPNGITWYQLTNPLCASILPWWSPR